MTSSERTRPARRPAERDRHEHRAPSDCPVCGHHLAVTRLGCASCGSELAGVFSTCEFCALSDADNDLLRVFLASRGNLREVERHLGVSYPTARLRFDRLLEKLGLADEPEDVPLTRDQVLSEVASGALSPEEAARLLRGAVARANRGRTPATQRTRLDHRAGFVCVREEERQPLNGWMSMTVTSMALPFGAS